MTGSQGSAEACPERQESRGEGRLPVEDRTSRRAPDEKGDMLAKKEVLTRDASTEHRCHEHHLRYLQADFPLDLSRAPVRPLPLPGNPGNPICGRATG